MKASQGLVAGLLLRPADILIPNWCCGHPAALDSHHIPLQQLKFTQAVSTSGHALEVDTHHKLNSNLLAYCSTGIEFILLVAKTLGGQSRETLRSIGSAINLK